MTAELAGYGPIETVVCDIDGVVLLGKEPVAGARTALEALRAAGLSLVFATNNSTRTPAMIRRHMVDVVGFDPGPNSVVNSGVATARHIVDRVDKVYVLGSDGLRETLRDEGIELTEDWREADAVVTGTDFNATYEGFASAGLAVQQGAAFYATNSDASYPRPDGLYPGAGALTSVVERTTGMSAFSCGKPYEPMRVALAEMGRGRRLIIGDRPDTDIALGLAEGWPTVLVLSGVIADPGEVPPTLRPDVVLESIAELPELLGLAVRDS
ncbi:MAG: HAD-IIA family hydrolase [Acidimicrobiia bacterium]|nr:HAD-IIA family hydrolase [Acidimicrobiia bacterium]